MSRRKLVAFVSSAALLVALLPGAAGAAQPASAGGAKAPVAPSENGIYIVQMVDQPVVAYEGGVKGLKATAPKQGQKIDPNAGDVVAYAGFLKGKHNAAVAAVGGSKLYSYVYSYNGFAAQLSQAQATKLAADAGVLAISPDEMHTVDTSSTPSFLGLTGANGFWNQTGATGEDVIIGIIDSGIWPESLSFADRTGTNGNATKDGKLAYQQIPGWHGKCTPGEAFNASMCNQKLIGAQYFNAGQGGDAGINTDRPWEFTSVRDYNGHGTHTASTSGGNADVATTGPAGAFGSISGIAPRARIAAYKALWSTEDTSTAGGTTSDLVAAIDQAVADGVDVINYSISGTSTNFADAVEISFLFAARAGIFVAQSAGNSGPTDSTVAHPGPWTTTVAAGTHNRAVSGSATLGNGATYSGASVAPIAVTAPLVNSSDAAMAGASAAAARLCFSVGTNGGSPALDPAKIAGKIVVCDRGTSARVDKSLAVKEAGGVGMILVNTSPNSLNADFHSLPTVHLQNTAAAPVHAYASIAGATATVHAAVFDYAAPAPYTASFSSRGPLLAGGGDVLKPDVIAPGQNILAAYSPVASGGLDFNQISGTSMSSPHVAGLAALLKDLKPDWSPMAIKSALMTSAYDVLDGPSTDPAVIFSQGAGHVRPNSAADPGLVYNAGWDDWRGFLRSQRLCTLCFGTAPAPVFDPSDYNGASIAIGDMTGTQTVTRKVTNVGSAATTYTPSITGLAGINAVVSPSSLALAKGETKSFTIAFTTTTATPNSYVGGQFTWTDGTHNVRIPVVIRPVALAAPAQVSGNGAPINYNVTFGYGGPFTATARGLVPAALTAGTVADDPTDSTCSLTSPNAQLIPVAIPLGTTYARFSLFDADVNAGSDIDLCVFNSIGTLIGSSGSGTSAEEVNIGSGTLDIGGTTYTVVVQGWGVVGSTPFKLHTWLLDSAAAGNMTVSAPAAAVIGTTGTINLSFSGLAAGTKYLGSVVYGGAAGMPNPTIVRVDAP